MANIIKRYRRRVRDSFAWKGRPTLYVVDFSREIQRDRQGIVREAPPCYHLPHVRGVCPMGLTHDTRVDALKNMVVDGLYNASGQHFINADDQPSLYISHIAGGTGTATTTGDMTALVNEVYRDTWTEEVELTSTSFNFSMFLGPDAGNGNFFHEWAAYAGDASLTLGSGLMMARWLYDFQKDATKTLYGDYVLSKA